MEKVYSRIRWENSPSVQTPLNETNLNKLDLAVDRIDDRVVELYGYEETAHGYATDAKNSADSAKSYMNTTSDYKDLAESYAKGTNDVVRPNDSTDNAKYYKEMAYHYLVGNILANFEISEDGQLYLTKTYFESMDNDHFTFSIIDNKQLQVQIS